MKITIQKTMDVQDPVRAHNADAGLDLRVPEGQTCLVRKGAVYMIDLGVRVAIPAGYYGQLVLRSSAGSKGLTMPHGVGIIDSGYRGNLKAAIATIADPVLVTAGERICQLIITPLPPVDVKIGVVDDNTDRGEGGFGSTGAHESSAPRSSEFTREGLTVGDLLSELQRIAFRYGTDIPVAIPAVSDADYEQATVPIVMHARRERKPDDWDLFHIDPIGEVVVGIS